MKTLLSVVIIGRNEGERLSRCLASVKAMQPVAGEVEIIYVDSGSTDDSLERARTSGAQTVALRSVRPTAAIGRNAGWRASHGEWILFLDGDTALDKRFACAALDAARNDARIAAVWGHRREMFPNANLFHRALDLDWVYRPGWSEFCGGDALMRREALEQTGGFDETLIAGEEPELCLRLRSAGYRILHIDAPMTLHDLAVSRWSQYWRRAFRAGYAYAQMAFRSRSGRLRLWAGESRANVVRTLALGALLAALCTPGAAPAAAGALLLLTLRSAFKARWKSDNRFSLLCYGVHSHLQQLPIFLGQAAFWWDQVRQRWRGLIEYK